MPRTAQPEPGKYARAVAAEIKSEIGRRSISRRELARRAGLSEPYLRDRLNDQYALTINDVAAICEVLDLDPSWLLQKAELWLSATPGQRRSHEELVAELREREFHEAGSNVTAFPDVGGSKDADDLQRAALDDVAASTDKSSVDPDR
ncbi:MAG: helix-turn-helix transcriptional regulator [Pseudolysinimonas sp.]